MNIPNMYLLTEWEGHTEKYLAGGDAVWTECSKSQIFSVHPDITHSIYKQFII